MVMEYWSGWFDLWGGLHHVYTAEGKMCFIFTNVKNMFSLIEIQDP